MPRLIISAKDKQDFLLGYINATQVIGACVEQELISEEHLGKMINSMAIAMFAVWRELKMPDEIFDAIIKGDSKALDESISYLKALDIPDKERALKANVLNWVINTVGLGYQLGAIFQKDETLKTLQ